MFTAQRSLHGPSLRDRISLCFVKGKRKQRDKRVYNLDSMMGTCLEVSMEKSGILQFYFCNSLLKDPRSLSPLNFQNVSALLRSDFLLIFDFGIGKVIFRHDLQQCSDINKLVLVLWVQFIHVQKNQQSSSVLLMCLCAYVLLTSWK